MNDELRIGGYYFIMQWKEDNQVINALNILTCICSRGWRKWHGIICVLFSYSLGGELDPTLS